MKIRLWAVLGANGVGESTTVGHLVGDFGKGENGLRRGRGGGMKDVLLRGGGFLRIHPRRQSLQEAGKTADVTIKMIKQLSAREEAHSPAIDAAYFNVLLALRTDQKHALPPASVYLSEFVKVGWQIESLVLLDPNDRSEKIYARFGAPICLVYDPQEIGILQMVGQVRNHFGWA